MRQITGVVFCLAIVVLQTADCTAAGYKFKNMWPKINQPWYFNKLAGIADDASDNIYLSDSGNNRIQKFSSNGLFITKWGKKGTDDGEFNAPKGIAVGPSGNVFVVDSGNNRIQKFASSGNLETVWGTAGSGQGQFGSPSGITVDALGYVYVADTQNHRIQKFTSGGAYVTEWGQHGSGSGQFDEPEALAADSQGYIHVIDKKNHRVQTFDTYGTFISTWGGYGENAGQFQNPFAVAVDGADSLYICDEANYPAAYRYQKFSNSGAYTGQWAVPNSTAGITVDSSGSIYLAHSFHVGKVEADGTGGSSWSSSKGEDTEKFVFPRGLAIDKDGILYVADHDHDRVMLRGPDGSFVAQWGYATHSINGPNDVAVDAYGNIYVTDYYNNQVQKMKPDGTVITKWGSKGSAPGQFYCPTGIAVDAAGNVYVAELGLNTRVQKFTPDGDFISMWGGFGSDDGQFIGPNGIAVGPSGNIYVADTGNGRIQKFTPDGQFIMAWGSPGSGDGEFNEPTDIAFNSSGDLYVVDRGNDRIQKFTQDGTFITQWGSEGSEPGQFSEPYGIEVDSLDRVYVVDTRNNRIQVFKYVDPSKFVSKAIVVAGGGDHKGNQLWDATQICTNYAVRALSFQGYLMEDIYYLSPDTDLDLDDNNIPDVDGDATVLNLKTAVTSWASDASDLVIYMTDHGGVKKFKINTSETLVASDLNQWLNQLQQDTDTAVTIIYDACQSGSFLGELKSGLYERIFISSSSDNQSAHFTSNGQTSFSYFFWSNIFNGMSVYDAYLFSQDAIETSHPSQTPLVNVNGNDTANEQEDIVSLMGLNIGNGTIMADDIPSINPIPQNIILKGETQSTISVTGVSDINGVEKVWAVVTPPDSSGNDPGLPVMALPEFELFKTADTEYQAAYGGFTEKGTYNVAVFARDVNGNISLPVKTSVIQKLDQPGASLNSQLNILLPCVNVSGTCYDMEFTLYDKSLLLWKLNGNYGLANCVPECAGLDNNFGISIPSIEHEGQFYKVFFKEHKSPDDPFGHYWKLDINSVEKL